MRIVFFGTPEFSADVLKYLLVHGVNVVAVVTKPDKPKGRSGTPLPTPVKQIAKEWNPELPIFQPPIVSVPEFADTLAAFEPDLFVVVAYGEIIKQHLLDMPKKGCINLHTSILPKYRGAAPIQRSIINGDTKTGVTIMHMVKKMDAGDVISIREVPIGPDDTFEKVEKDLCRVGSEALLNVIHLFEKGTVPRIPQNDAEVTFAPKIELEDCEIDWKLPAKQLHNLIRGVNPEPGAWCYVLVKGQKKRMKIFSTKVVEKTGQPGQILEFGKDGFIIACGEKSLQLIELQPEGKKSMKAEDFVRGISCDQITFQI